MWHLRLFRGRAIFLSKISLVEVVIEEGTEDAYISFFTFDHTFGQFDFKKVKFATEIILDCKD